MDQSLRTVATQLLNVTNTEDVMKNEEKPHANNVLAKLIFVDTTTKDLEKTKVASTDVEIMDPSSLEANPIKSLPYERPVNSKFGYIESSHPGQAMAITEEELEKELSSMKHPSTHKVQPTTSGGISTWILLNPPTTTTNLPSDDEDKTKYPFSNEGQLIVKTTSFIKKVESNDQKPLVATIEKVTTTQPTVNFEKIDTQAPKKSTPNLIRKPALSSTPKPEKLALKPEKSTQQSDKITQKPEKGTQSDKKVEKQTQSTTSKNTTPKSTTPIQAISDKTQETSSNTSKTVNNTKNVPQPTSRTTAKPKVENNNKASATTVKQYTTKVSKPNPQNRPKIIPQRKSTPKPEVQKIENSATSKIEKVTLKPFETITTQTIQPEETEGPIFMTKVKASVFSETKKTTPLAMTPATTTISTNSIPAKEDLAEVPVKSKHTANKANNVLKVHLKKPVDDLTKIEIEPIKVNAPVLKIEKVKDEVKKNVKIEDSTNEQDLLDNSRIDLKFDFNPELTRIDVETPPDTTVSTSSTTTTRPTSKKRQSSNKRKKNKTRRRKPSTTASSSTSDDSEMSVLSTISELLNISDSNSTDNSAQESKIEPETKVSTNFTKNKKKQVQKPISTQIYNFLSREVMPSFGVMSLVGLGLGLASYFLYPFGGSIARRNYQLEPNYKYNVDEYGGNYGQSEEEVFSKVIQGMTKHESKYGGVKDYGTNYYKYQHFDGPYSTTIKSNDKKHSTLSNPTYRPLKNSYEVNYRNTEFKYPDLPTTPNYYERQKQTDLVAGKEVNVDRQFVVGNVPKEYSYEEKLPSITSASKRDDYEVTDGPSKFEREMAQNFNFPKNSVNIPQTYAQVQTQITKNDDGYEEIEITPSAVAVEHGPRFLRVRRSASENFKRESVIQVIPSKSELQKEHREEEIPLSNEILDIIDSAIPIVEENVKTKDTKKEKFNEKAKEKINEETLKTQKKGHEEKKNTTIKDNMLSPESPKENVKGIISSSTESMTTSIETTVSSKSSTPKITVTAETESSKAETTMSSSSTTIHPNTKDIGTTEDWFDNLSTEKPKESEQGSYNIFGFMRKIAEIKIKLGLTLLKHASEGFARYLGHVQKRMNGEE